MATAATVVKQILSEILVREVESALEPGEIQDTITNMNFYMLAQAANGINLGYTEVKNLGDTVTIPDGALMGLIANVAIMVAPAFGAETPPQLIAKAKIGLNAMRKLGVKITPMRFPDTLPIGSGNEDNFEDNRFYAAEESTILTEGGGSIGLEDNTDGS